MPMSARRLAARNLQSVSALGLIRAMAAAGWITGDEARAWVGREALPAIVDGVISTLPSEDQLDAELRALGMTTADRADPLVGAVALAAGADQAAVDALFEEAKRA